VTQKVHARPKSVAKTRSKSTPQAKRAAADSALSSDADLDDSFPVVAIGASAGGLEAYTEFFHALSPDTGMAFVLVQHLDPNHHSLLTEIIAKTTRISVEEVKSGTKVLPNRAYVISRRLDPRLLRIGFQKRSDDASISCTFPRRLGFLRFVSIQTYVGMPVL
jgi:chemotaxis response regulator CheB